MSKKSTETVKVMVRCRPMNKKEIDLGTGQAVFVDETSGEIKLLNVKQPDAAPRQFTFDSTYGVESKQQSVYDECAFGLVESVLKGYNGTMFAYGQTGCGKTHTMMGPSHPDGPEAVPDDDKGVIPKALRHIFAFIGEADKETKFLVRCSYLEIYNEQVLDLLSNKKADIPLQLKDDPQKGTYVKDLTTVITKGVADTERALFFGLKNRKTGATAMNAESSRSHSIFTVYIETAIDDPSNPKKQKIKAGKLNLVDLAGSERQSKTQATGVRLDEAKNINLSLSALGNVIKALVDGTHHHIPYRDSKLTRLLQDSLGGNTKTVMMAALSPADYNYDETLSTLRYADRAKAIKNKPRINEDPKDALLREYESEITQLREMLAQMKGTGATSQEMGAAFTKLQGQINDNKEHNQVHVEENVDSLMARMEAEGKRVKIMTVEEEEAEQAEKNQMKAKMDELMIMQKDREKLDAQNAGVHDELANKEQLLAIEQEEKAKLEEMLKQMNEKMVAGGEHQAQEEVMNAQRQRQYSMAIKKNKKQAKQIQEAEKNREQEMLEVEHEFKSVQEEVQQSRLIIKKLKLKYDQALNEIKDLQSENVGEKEDLMIQLRQQEYDVKFYKNLVQNVMKTNEIAKLKAKSVWDDGINDWQIPAFLLKAKAVELPSLSIKKNAQNEFMEQQKDEREMQIDGDSDDQGGSSNDNGQSSYLQQYEQSRGTNGLNGSSQKKHRQQQSNRVYEYEQPQAATAMMPRKAPARIAPLGNGAPKWQQRSEQSQSSLGVGMTPDPMIRNQKAQAQLAPLGHFSPAMPNPDIQKQSNSQLPNMPSFEQLQTYNKLAPLDYPSKHRQRPV